MNNCTIKLLIPCDCIEDNNCLKKSKILDGSRLLSPIFGFSNCNQILKKIESGDFFASCGFSKEKIYQKLSLESFKPVECFCPYGLVWKAELEFERIEEWLLYFNCYFDLRNITTRKPDPLTEKQEWNIKAYPIIMLETNNCNESEKDLLIKRLKLSDADKLFEDCIILDNPIVFISKKLSSSLYRDILDALKMVCSIYSISRDVRMELGKTLKSSTGKNNINGEFDENDIEVLLKIQKRCSLVKEVSSNIIFRTNQQKKIYELVKEKFHISDILDQVDGACSIIENYIEMKENFISKKIEEKAHNMNSTVFITGYVGLILAVFSFFPLELKNLYWIEIPDEYNLIKLLIYIIIVIVSIGICTGLVYCYEYLLKHEKNVEKLKLGMCGLSILIIIVCVICL